MKLSVVILACALVAGCAGSDLTQKKMPCTGNTVKGCEPVIYYNYNSFEISPKGYDRLNWACEKLNRFPDRDVKVIGYADEAGSEAYNVSLSYRRALGVKDYLMQCGVFPDRIKVVSLGNQDFVCQSPECSDIQSCQSINRRVEVKIEANKRFGQ